MQLKRLLFVLPLAVPAILAAAEPAPASGILARVCSNLAAQVVGPAYGPELQARIDALPDPRPNPACPSGLGSFSDRLVEDCVLARTLAPADLALLATLRPDGSWPDLDYGDTRASEWSPQQHAARVRQLARLAATAPDAAARDAALERARRALGFWFRRRPVAKNWWFNQIGTPRAFAAAFSILNGSLTPEERRLAHEVILSRSRIGRTGQNRVALAMNVLMDAIITGDEKLGKAARDAVLGEIKVTGGEGIQTDFSFHQHGPQPQFGNYGAAYFMDIARAAEAFRGTAWAFPPEQLAILRRFYTDGLRWTVWNGYFDVAGLGRQLFPREPLYKAAAIDMSLASLDHAEGAAPAAETPPPAGFRFFPRSACGYYRAKGWMASVKGSTKDILGTETKINGDGVLSGQMADGALYFYRRGDEYLDVFPLWNWRLVPGVTTLDLPRPSAAPNRGEAMTAVTTNGHPLVTLALDREDFVATKSWLFTDEGVDCAGTGITSTNAAPVVTCVEQRAKRGPLEVLRGGRWEEVAAPVAFAATAGSPAVFRHDGVQYTITAGAGTAGVYHRKGAWRAFMHSCPRELTAEGDIAQIVIEHGVRPRNAGYSYRVAAAVPPPRD